MKHSPPFIADAVRAIGDTDINHFVGIVLAPHFSSMSVGDYFGEVRRALQLESSGVRWTGVSSWHLDPGLIQLLAARIAKTQTLFSLAERESLVTIFTAHSLPQRILKEGDPYPEQVRQTGEMVAEHMGLDPYLYSWQSAGRTREPWMVPDILDTVRALHSEGVRSVLICPAGFVSDHLEVLYDLDIECRQLCDHLGVHMERTASFNDDPDFLKVLGEVVERQRPDMEAQ
jgi:ferrochelatase